MIEQIVNELARFAGRLGLQFTIQINPEGGCQCPVCRAGDPLDDEIIDVSDGDGPDS